MHAARLALGALAATAVGLPASAADIECNASTADKLYVSVTGVKTSSGQVAVTLYANNPKKFLARHGSLGVARTPAQAGTTRVCVAVPGPGRYAVAVYHDVDGDGHIDRNLIGLPSEPFALSNNPPPKMAFPSIGPSLFTAQAGETSITVRLQKPPKKGEAPAAAAASDPPR
jgi:uncharacterized protein (DUF2141 family)